MGEEVLDNTMLLSLALKAVLPWRSVYAEPIKVETYDSQSDIDRCCRCDRAECVNCLGGQKQISKGGSKKKYGNVFAEIINGNLNAKEACELTGMSKMTYYRYKKLFLKGELT